MSSLGSLESLIPYRALAARRAETRSLPLAGEEPLALFLGAGHVAYLFTNRRFLILKRAKPLARALAGRKLIDFKNGAADIGLEDVLGRARVKAETSVSEVAYVDAERVYSAGAIVVYAGGRKHSLTLGEKRREIAPHTEALLRQLGIPRSAARLAMKRELKSWTLFSILTGATSLLASLVFPGLLDPLWGLALVAMGAGILCSAEPAMFVVLGVGMVWAAVMNLLGLSASPLRGGQLQLAPIFQVYWAGVLFTRYRKYEHLYDGGDAADKSVDAPGRAAARVRQAARSLAATLTRRRKSPAMPLLSLVIAAIEVLLLLSLFEAWLLEWPRQVLSWLSHGQMHLAVLGTAVGLASLCSRRGARWAAATGAAVNAVTVATIVSLLVAGLLRR